MANKSRYDVFISYSRKDYVDERDKVIPGNVVSLIKERLTAAGISYWFDEEGIYSGQNFVEKIVTNIEVSDIFIYLSTANANKSQWTAKEIATAEELHKHIIPVRIDNTPYNRKVLFRIADLDYIEYYVNPEKAINDLIEAIKKHLEQLREEMHGELDELPHKDIVTFHEAFPYFAREFKLNIAAVIEHEPGEEPSPKEIAACVDKINSLPVKVLFTEPQYSPKAAEIIAAETGATIYTLDPVVTGEADEMALNVYTDRMRANAAVLKAALGN